MDQFPKHIWEELLFRLKPGPRLAVFNESVALFPDLLRTNSQDIASISKWMRQKYVSHENELYIIANIGGGKNVQHVHLETGFTVDLRKVISTLYNISSPIIRLDVTHKSLSTVPFRIRLLTSLRYLDLSSNNLVTFPSAIATLTHLEYLSLSNNQIADLTNQIGWLSNLIVLNVSFNLLTETPNTIGYLQKLIELNVSYNRLANQSLITEMTYLEQLRILYIHGNYQLNTIPNFIIELPSLRLISVDKHTEVPLRTGLQIDRR